jgi:hypothetical protein
MSTQHTRNIMRTFRSCTPADIAEGTAWYREAREFAASLDTDVRRAVGVIAVLSPMVSWPRNQTLARAHYAGVYGGCLGASTVKAQRILSGEPVDAVVKGKKVKPFFDAIMGDPDSVTLDRHAIDVAMGRTLTDGERNAIATTKRREPIVESYRRAARITGYSPAEVQAIVWVGWRKRNAQAFHVNG